GIPANPEGGFVESEIEMVRDSDLWKILFAIESLPQVLPLWYCGKEVRTETPYGEPIKWASSGDVSSAIRQLPESHSWNLAVAALLDTLSPKHTIYLYWH
ncbi:MAG: hypothetical protein ACIAXF_14150, partial [Phycisphaerales bacterium JB063]